MAATNNGYGCTAQLATAGTSSSNDPAPEYPKIIFCDNQFEQGCDSPSCNSYASLYAPPCSTDEMNGCWVPYLVTAPGTCVPWKCSQFGVFTEGGRYENGGFTRATFSMDACEGEDASAGKETETCPAFDASDASAVYPDPGCPGSERSAGALPNSSIMLVWAAALFLGFD
jgi:hypothetical protein